MRPDPIPCHCVHCDTECQAVWVGDKEWMIHCHGGRAMITADPDNPPKHGGDVFTDRDGKIEHSEIRD